MKTYRYPVAEISWGDEEIAGVLDSLNLRETTMGRKVAEFESQFSKLIGGRETIMVNSGSSADLLMMFAAVNPKGYGLHPGDEVIAPAVTWPTHIWSAVAAGLKVRLVDIDPNTLNIDLNKLDETLSRRSVSDFTVGMLIVHLMGNPVNMDRIEELKLPVWEDCCEALGSTFGVRQVGTFGEAGAFSFFHSHHISTCEGGMIACLKETAPLYRQMRSHGWTKGVRGGGDEVFDTQYQFQNIGFNVRPTELNAAFGLAQLPKLGRFSHLRRERAAQIFGELEPWADWIHFPEVHPKAVAEWFAIPFLLTEACPFTRKQFVEYLESEGIETRPIMSGNFARQPAVKLHPQIIADGPFPGADVVHERGFYIGVHSVEESPVDWLIDTIERFLRKQ